MKKIILSIALSLSAAVPLAHAVCPVCTVAVGAGLGLAQWLGIDDSISGLWIGGLAVSLIAWTIDWLNRKNIRFTGRKILVAVGYYLLLVAPLWWKGLIGHPLNTLCGIDKLLFGIILGTVLFVAGVALHNYLRRRNENKSYFKGQKIVSGIAPLIIASIILYFAC
ncbi:MAG: hypothetical protein QMD77_01710 [Patescibacteria group bacterium]|nr:hypothetical protein [Patescibacteria group bacterium]